MLERGPAAARAEGPVARVDTMNPDNVPFNQAQGMAVRRRIRLGAGGPAVRAMATSSTWPARAGR